MAYKKTPLSPEHLAECAALYDAIKEWNDGRPRSERISQRQAGEMSGMTQGAFSNYLNGRMVLNKNLALIVYQVFGIPAHVYSHRLAEEIRELSDMRADPSFQVDVKDSSQAPLGRKPSTDLIRLWESLNVALIKLPSVPFDQISAALKDIESKRTRLSSEMKKFLYRS